FVTRISHQYGVFPLGGQTAVPRDDGPSVGHCSNFPPACVDHRLNSEDHARLEQHARARLAIMEHLGILVEIAADPMATILSHDRESLRFGVLLNGVADVAQA